MACVRDSVLDDWMERCATPCLHGFAMGRGIECPHDRGAVQLEAARRQGAGACAQPCAGAGRGHPRRCAVRRQRVALHWRRRRWRCRSRSRARRLVGPVDAAVEPDLGVRTTLAGLPASSDVPPRRCPAGRQAAHRGRCGARAACSSSRSASIPTGSSPRAGVRRGAGRAGREGGVGRPETGAGGRPLVNLPKPPNTSPRKAATRSRAPSSTPSRRRGCCCDDVERIAAKIARLRAANAGRAMKSALRACASAACCCATGSTTCWTAPRGALATADAAVRAARGRTSVAHMPRGRGCAWRCRSWARSSSSSGRSCPPGAT